MPPACTSIPGIAGCCVVLLHSAACSPLDQSSAYNRIHFGDSTCLSDQKSDGVTLTAKVNNSRSYQGGGWVCGGTGSMLSLTGCMLCHIGVPLMACCAHALCSAARVYPGVMRTCSLVRCLRAACSSLYRAVAHCLGVHNSSNSVWRLFHPRKMHQLQVPGVGWAGGWMMM